MTTMSEVARHAGVSTATVSRVLNGKQVRADLAARVRESVAVLNYTPDRTARSLRRRSSEVLALIIPDVENPFFTSLARGVEDVARAAAYSVVLCNTDDVAAQEIDYLTVAADENMAGVIIAPASSRPQLNVFMTAERAVVVVDRKVSEPVDQVTFDNGELGRLATETLLQRGLHRIACVTGPKKTSTAIDRADGWREALISAGITPDPELTKFSTFQVDGGYRATRELLASSTEIDGIVATNNLVGVGALRAVADHAGNDRVRVSVIGDLPFATSRRGDIDVIPLNPSEMGRTAARLLLDRLQGGEQPPRHIVQYPAATS